MPHVLIVGMTESGKTTYAINLAKSYSKHGIKTIVLDPLLDPRWKADFITDDYDKFIAVIMNPATLACAIFIDESGESIDKYNRDKSYWLATRGRHYGHNVHFIAQRITQIAKTVRDQCSLLIMFNVSFDDAKELSNEWNKEEIKEANTLKKGEYFSIKRFGDIQRGDVFKEIGGIQR